MAQVLRRAGLQCTGRLRGVVSHLFSICRVTRPVMPLLPGDYRNPAVVVLNALTHSPLTQPLTCRPTVIEQPGGRKLWPTIRATVETFPKTGTRISPPRNSRSFAANAAANEILRPRLRYLQAGRCCSSRRPNPQVAAACRLPLVPGGPRMVLRSGSLSMSTGEPPAL
jgi:hypothetical protein